MPALIAVRRTAPTGHSAASAPSNAQTPLQDRTIRSSDADPICHCDEFGRRSPSTRRGTEGVNRRHIPPDHADDPSLRRSPGGHSRRRPTAVAGDDDGSYLSQPSGRLDVFRRGLGPSQERRGQTARSTAHLHKQAGTDIRPRQVCADNRHYVNLSTARRSTVAQRFSIRPASRVATSPTGDEDG